MGAFCGPVLAACHSEEEQAKKRTEAIQISEEVPPPPEADWRQLKLPPDGKLIRFPGFVAVRR